VLRFARDFATHAQDEEAHTDAEIHRAEADSAAGRLGPG
jgi:hypothetical protein